MRPTHDWRWRDLLGAGRYNSGPCDDSSVYVVQLEFGDQPERLAARPAHRELLAQLLRPARW